MHTGRHAVQFGSVIRGIETIVQFDTAVGASQVQLQEDSELVSVLSF